MPISWYPRNFTNPDLNFFDQNMHISDDAVYGVQLGLYVIGYKESKDDQVKTFSLKATTPTVITLTATSFAEAMFVPNISEQLQILLAYISLVMLFTWNITVDITLVCIII